MRKKSNPESSEKIIQNYRRDIYALTMVYGTEVTSALAGIFILVTDKEKLTYPALAVAVSFVMATLLKINLRDTELSVINSIFSRKINLDDESKHFLQLGTVLAESQELQSLFRAAYRRKN